MAKPEPIYTADNIKVAYQLLWSLSVFWREPPGTEAWLDDLKPIAEADGVRILEHRFATPTASLFLLSTRPELIPHEIPRVIKGRLQFLVRHHWPKAFQRNYDLHSIGSTTREKTEAYVASQIEHHVPGDASLKAQLEDLQIVNPEVDLGRQRYGEHARYTFNLHLVMVHNWREPVADLEKWKHVRSILRDSAQQKGWWFSRLGFVPDHIHLTLGATGTTSPLSVALSCMNNASFAHDMRPILMASCFIGTIGEYDVGAVKNP